jgi:hypothetical protein
MTPLSFQERERVEAVAAQILAALRTARAQAEGEALTSFSWGDEYATRLTLLAELRTMATRIDMLEANLSRVYSGEWTFEKWAELARTYHAVLQSHAASVGDWTFGGMVADVAAGSWEDIKSGAAVAAPWLAGGGAIVGLALVAYLVFMLRPLRG